MIKNPTQNQIKLTDALMLIMLAAIWGSSFIFMRATAADFGPIFLIMLRVGGAAICLVGFLFVKKRFEEFKQNWLMLGIVGLFNSALPFTLLAYSSLYLNAGIIAILNSMTPIFTAWIAHFWLKDKMNTTQFIGLAISIAGTVFLVWDKLSIQVSEWWPVLAGIGATLFYGIAITATKKHLGHVSSMTATAGSMLFSGLFMISISLFFIPDFKQISSLGWLYAATLAILCTAFAYIVFFRLIKNIGSTSAASVTFLIPVFALIWAYLLLGEVVTLKMLIAASIILFGTGLVTGLIKIKDTEVPFK